MDLLIPSAKPLAFYIRSLILCGNISHYIKQSRIKEKLTADCVCEDAKQKDEKQQSEVAAKKITVGYGARSGGIQNKRG